MQNFFGYESGAKKSISAQLCWGPSQCRISSTLTPQKCLQGPPNGGLQKMFSTLCYISRRNGLQKNTLIADTILAEPGP